MKNIIFFQIGIAELINPYHKFPTIKGALFKMKNTTTTLIKIELIVPRSNMRLQVLVFDGSLKRRGSNRRASYSYLSFDAAESFALGLYITSLYEAIMIVLMARAK